MLNYQPIINRISFNDYKIGILRLDLIHPEISGNKWFKLKYNLQEAKNQQKDTIITFGGAFSNHILATSVACKLNGFKAIGIIRGEEKSAINPTLQLAKQHGMELQFVSRELYKQKHTSIYLQKIQALYPNAYIIPEGGDNELGQKGCEDILINETSNFPIIFCAHGTGTTYKGISKSLSALQRLMVINVLKFEAIATEPQTQIINQYHFGGYAKHTSELLEFKDWFEKNYAIPLDYVYTSKLFFAVFDLIKKNKLNKEQGLLIIHCGGLQGNIGYEQRYNLKPSRKEMDAQG
jgi:1-aminocyclopropane-1-carboxylate deaminase